MKKLLRYRDPLTLCAAVLLPLALSGILVPFRSTFAPTASALVFVAMIVAVAVVGNRTAGILATVSSTLWFDFFLTRPYERLAVADRADVETAVTLFIVGVVVTELAARSRHHHSVAAEEADLIGMLYQFSELVAAGAPDTAVIARLAKSSSHFWGCGTAGSNMETANVPASSSSMTPVSSWVELSGPSKTWGYPAPKLSSSSISAAERSVASSSPRPRDFRSLTSVASSLSP